MILTLILCYPVAFWVSRLSDRWRLVFLFLITLPFFSSLIVRLYAWLLILKPTGLLNTVLLNIGLISEPLEILYTPAAVVLGMVYVMVPFMFLPLYAAVDNLDRAQVEASQDLGANRVQTFFKVILPAMKASLISAAILMWVTTISELSASVVVYTGGLETMPIAIFRQVDGGRLGLASAYGAALVSVILLPIVVAIKVFRINLFSSK